MEKIIEFQNVSKSFGDLEVLKNLDLHVYKGEKLALIGPSGSGKTTILRILMTLETIDTGHVVIDGDYLWHQRLGNDLVPASEKHLHYMRTNVGMVFQQFNLWPHMTALENVLLGLDKALGVPPKEATERAEKQLEKMGLSDKLNAYPGTLSGGQQQRVALARALALEPALIMFDEATSALDAELVAGILEEMRRLAEEGMTMIVVTHEIGFARKVGDRLLFMDQGVVVEEGIPQEVLNNPQHPETQAFLSSMIWE